MHSVFFRNYSTTFSFHYPNWSTVTFVLIIQGTLWIHRRATKYNQSFSLHCNLDWENSKMHENNSTFQQPLESSVEDNSYCYEDQETSAHQISAILELALLLQSIQLTLFRFLRLLAESFRSFQQQQNSYLPERYFWKIRKWMKQEHFFPFFKINFISFK